MICRKKGERDKALSYYLKSEQICLKVGDRAGLGPSYNNIQSLYYQKQNWDKAIEYALKSEQIKMEVGDRAGLAFTYFNIGTIYLQKKEKPKADSYLILAGYIAVTQGMRHELEQMAWALNPVIEELGQEKFMEEGGRLCGERGIRLG